MRKFLVFVILCLCAICGLHINNLYMIVSKHQQNIEVKDDEYYEQMRYVPEPAEEAEIAYDVYLNNRLDTTYEFYADAVDYAKIIPNTSIYERHTGLWVWDNFPPYELNINNVRIMYSSFIQAREDADQQEDAFISFRTSSSSTVWQKGYINKGAHMIDVALIRQLPELARGCEVTSLAMLLNYKGVEIDKMILAEEVERHENNPYKGFVGDMYQFSKPGYGVYNAPIFDLAHKYLPETAMNMTYCNFDDLYYLIDNDNPVWVIINATYAPLPGSRFVIQPTDEGNILITYSEHSVLVTGYDERYIYFNDPLGQVSKAEKTKFIEAWEQMGRQAVTTSR